MRGKPTVRMGMFVANPVSAHQNAEVSVESVRAALVPLRRHLKEFVLLGGAVREAGLARSCARSVLDLPLKDGATPMSTWLGHAQALASAAGVESLHLRVLTNPLAKRPADVASPPGVHVSIDTDPGELRGTGGLLRDIAIDRPDDDFILVSNAAQVVLHPLPELVASMAQVLGDAVILADADSTATGLMLVRVGLLKTIKSKGFIDFKEQVLPALARDFDIRVVRRDGTPVMPLRTLEHYLGALRLLHVPAGAAPLCEDPLAEDWHPTFAVIEPGAQVDATARVHDSVVLRGARVGSGAVLVRALVSEDALVNSGDIIGDRAVTSDTSRRAAR